MKAEFNINFEVADLSTIHEAYQFVFKKYVEDCSQDINFLTLEDIKKNNEKRKKKKSETENTDEEGDLRLKGRRSRYVKDLKVSRSLCRKWLPVDLNSTVCKLAQN